MTLTLIIAYLAGVYSAAAAAWWVGRSAARLAGKFVAR